MYTIQKKLPDKFCIVYAYKTAWNKTVERINTMYK